MFKNMSLQTRLTSAFLFVGAIVLFVALLAWDVNHKLSESIDAISTDSVPSIIGLWKVNEGKTQIESSERALLNDELTKEERTAEIERIKKAWQQIATGFKQHEVTLSSEQEKRLYDQLLIQWNQWKQNHEKFIQIEQQFEGAGILNPRDKELELVRQNQDNSLQMAAVRRSNQLLDQLIQQAKNNRPSFEATTELLIKNISLNEEFSLITAKNAQKEGTRGKLWMIIALAIGPTTAVAFGFLFSRTIITRVAELLRVAHIIASNNTPTQLQSEVPDELGKLQIAFYAIATKISELVSMAQKISGGDANGQIQLADNQDAISKLHAAFYTVASKISELVNVAQKISGGDLTGQIQVSGQQDEIGKLQMAFYTMSKDLNTLIRRIQHSGVQITTSATQIAASGKELEATATEQLASTNEVKATAQGIASTSKNLVKLMEKVGAMTQTTATAASDSREELQEMESTMRQLTEATTSIASKLGVMNKKASNINNVVVTITKVADQTSILSLNAAIEAEKAGEYGAGFAVVAREIRRLANQTAVATLEIEQIVKDMQSAVTMGVMEMDKFNSSVRDSVERVNKISHQIAKVINQVESLPPQFEQVSQNMEEQSQGAQQISEVMGHLSEASHQTVDALRETNSALEQLDDAAQSLRTEISHFKVHS